MKKQYTGIFAQEETGWWVARCAEIPAAITQGKNLREAKKNLKSAIVDVLEYEYQASMKGAKRNARIIKVAV